ncbi:senescence-inducible chloroplast stay-green protein, partial [Trifolium pratense]
VIKAFVHGDENLFNNYPELQEALVWVYFHSKIPEFNKVECWGPLKEASQPNGGTQQGDHIGLELPKPCQEDCECCFPPLKLSSPIPCSNEVPNHTYEPIDGIETQQSL